MKYVFAKQLIPHPFCPFPNTRILGLKTMAENTKVTGDTISIQKMVKNHFQVREAMDFVVEGDKCGLCASETGLVGTK